VTAPASTYHREAATAIDDAVALLRAMVQRRRERAAAGGSAGSVRPFGADDRPTMHEAAPAPASNRDGFEEDSRHVPTSTAGQF
jgi:hypothetical protein